MFALFRLEHNDILGGCQTPKKQHFVENVILGLVANQLQQMELVTFRD
jgi:hypothetical protein